MKKKYFYTHIIDTSSLFSELENMDLTENEKAHLTYLVDSSIHHEVLGLILSELGDHDKKAFLIYLASENHEKIWKFLKGKLDHIEEKIKKTAEDLKNELHKDIKEAKD